MTRLRSHWADLEDDMHDDELASVLAWNSRQKGRMNDGKRPLKLQGSSLSISSASDIVVDGADDAFLDDADDSGLE